MKTSRWFSLFAGLFVIAACSSTGNDAIENTDGGVANGDAADASNTSDGAHEGGQCAEASCEPLPDVARYCPHAVEGECEESPISRSYELIAKAGDLGEGMHFLTLRDDLVLAQDANGTPFVYALPSRIESEELPVTLRSLAFDPPPPAGMRGKAVAGSASRGVAVLCDGASCVVYRAENEGDDVVFRPMTTPVPNDGRGIEGAFTPDRYDFCVYGEGLHCLRENRWETLDDGSRGKLLAVNARGAWLVGEKGRALFIDHEGEDSCVREIGTGLDADLYAVEGGWTAWAVGADGNVVLLSLCEAKACRIEERDFVGLAAGSSGFSFLLTKEGERLDWSPFGFCKEKLPSAARYVIRHCGVANNVWALTPDEIRGELRCVAL